MKKLLVYLAVLGMPLVVSASVAKDTPALGDAVKDRENIKELVEADLNKNESIKNASAGYYIEGLKISCTNSKNEILYMNDKLSSNLTCANGNTKPYFKVIASGTTAFENASACLDDGVYAYATRVSEYNCNYLMASDGTQGEEYKKEESTTAPSTKDDVESTTTKQTGTTENANTGVEDYFLVLGIVGSALTALLYIVDKKNSFKKI